MSHFDVYGRMALVDQLSETTQNGRYTAQGHAEKYVPEDIITKLRPVKSDIFLDIGCGLGLNLEPISAIVREAHACDHPNVIERLKQKNLDLNAKLYGGNFIELDFQAKYTKILAYSVLPALPDEDTVFAFIDKVLSVMDLAGVTLLGDLANIDKKRRFMESRRGQDFQKEWDALIENTPEDADLSQFQEDGDSDAVVMDDTFILEMLKYIREKGFHAYVVAQPRNLPFGNTREDLLIVGPEYEYKV